MHLNEDVLGLVRGGKVRRLRRELEQELKLVRAP